MAANQQDHEPPGVEIVAEEEEEHPGQRTPSGPESSDHDTDAHVAVDYRLGDLDTDVLEPDDEVEPADEIEPAESVYAVSRYPAILAHRRIERPFDVATV